MPVSIKQLKAFVAVVEGNLFSLAAERLNATQSGMSMLLQNLELSIGKKLVNRVPGNVVLTDSGNIFYKYALEILSLMDKALIDTQTNKENLSGTFNCGLMPTLCCQNGLKLIDQVTFKAEKTVVLRPFQKIGELLNLYLFAKTGLKLVNMP